MALTQSEGGKGRLSSPTMTGDQKKIHARARARAAARAERYWIARGYVHCRHGVILYGTKCVTCEREIDAVCAGGAV